MMNALKISMTLLGLMLLSACSSLFEQGEKQARSSSLMTFLYPDEESRRSQQPATPRLALPIKVGIAFVPTNAYASDIPLATQMQLLEKVRAEFIGYEYIDSIEMIPSTYLQGSGGFESLDQLSRLYDIDVVGLVSYDQVSQSQENNAALLYWTIVGMYLIPANENRTQTFVDTAVFDINDRSLLFRAPGISQLENSSTAATVKDAFAEQNIKGFNQAVDNMIINLKAELSRFEDRVKNEGAAEITHQAHYSGGGGSLGVALTALFMATLIRRKRIS